MARQMKDLSVRRSDTRKLILGLISIGLGLLVILVFNRPFSSSTVSTFLMTPGGYTEGVMDDILVPARMSLWISGGIMILAGLYHLFVGFGKKETTFLILFSILFVFSFLVYVSADKRINIASLFSSALSMAVPITLGAFSGILCERSGVVNIAIEGMMLMGAMVGSIVGSVTGSIWLGLIAAMLSSALLALVHAWLSIKYKINQIISGTVINIFSTGMTSFISSMFLQNIQSLNKTPRFPNVSIPLLSKIPFFGPVLFSNSLFVYGMILLLVVLQFALFRTRWGLRLRSVGEHPKAADTLGINVYRTRYMAVILGGLVAGFGGAYFSLGSVGRFDEGMTAGKGFIGLAAMIFGGWIPFKAMLAGILFGFADALASSVSILRSPIPGQFINMLPYIVTIVVLAGVVGSGSGPAAAGTPYDKE
ncbi:MAG: ABC transporter permease [Chloroflexi bacterium]|nr:ABC transporter permease [Chloroflexota bacterium]